MSDSGSSVIKHGLNPEKVFMQVHYLKVSASKGQKPVVMGEHCSGYTYKHINRAGAQQRDFPHCNVI